LTRVEGELETLSTLSTNVENENNMEKKDNESLETQSSQQPIPVSFICFTSSFFVCAVVPFQIS
jgi:hypothetical protein